MGSTFSSGAKCVRGQPRTAKGQHNRVFLGWLNPQFYSNLLSTLLNDFSDCASSGSIRVSYDLAQPAPATGFLVEFDVEIGGHGVQGTVMVSDFQELSYLP